MRLSTYILTLLTTLFAGIIAFGQENIQFIENKGQWNAQVKYMGVVGGGAFYVHEDGFTVLQHNPEDWQEMNDLRHEHRTAATGALHQKDFVLRSHSYRMRFLNGKKGQVIADKPLYTYNNYFIGDDPTKWASNCRIYQGVTIKDVYPNVDVRYYSGNGTVKYDIIVHPGGNINDIALKYDGTEKMEVKNRELVLKTSVGDLRELQPYSYQFKASGKKDVDVRYTLKGNVVRFSAKNYDNNSTLIIDPQLVFASFAGSVAENWGFTATYGPDGSMFGGGIVFSQGFPVSDGAFQKNYGGGGNCFNSGIDIGVIKLSPDGTQRMYATYIGGIGDEMPQSLIVDSQGNLVIAGRTNSTDYPRTQPVIGSGGGWDIVLTKLNATGSALIGSVVIGGKNNDGANVDPCGKSVGSFLQWNYGDEARSEVNFDNSGNILLSSCTQSDNFPLVSQIQSTLKGVQDGVILKFNSNLSSLLFSTYFGGSKYDAAYVISSHPVTGDLYIAGGTESDDLPGTSAGKFAAFNGKVDGFITVIDNTSYAIKNTIYLGTSERDQIYGLQFDLNGYPYVMGQTYGVWPVINANWSMAAGKQFIAKLDVNLSDYIYSTTFGTNTPGPNISPVAFLVDRCENVYVSGWGGYEGNYAGTYGLPVTTDAIQPNTDGKDFYFFVLKKNADNILFGSFYGKNGGFPDHVDGGTSRFDKNGVIYEAICADCKKSGPPSSGRFPTTPGVWAFTNPSSNCNLAMVKIDFQLSGVRGEIETKINGEVGDTSGCIPFTVDFSDKIRIAQSYIWDFGDGSPREATTSPQISHNYTAVGVYRAMMIAIDPNSCFTRDTSYVTIKAGDEEARLNFEAIKIFPCEDNIFDFSNLSQIVESSTGLPLPNKSFTSTSFTWDFGDGSPQVVAGLNTVTHAFQPGVYTVSLSLNDDSYCNYPEVIKKTVSIAPLIADFEAPETGCDVYTAQFKNLSTGATRYLWDFGGKGTSTEENPVFQFPGPGTYAVTLTAIDPGDCYREDKKTLMVTVYPTPVADYTKNTPEVNKPVIFTNTSSSDSKFFTWNFGDGEAKETTSRADLFHDYNLPGSYNACLIAVNEYGCADTTCQIVEIPSVIPAIDVPNAFTPTQSSNNVVYARGFGVTKINFTVWSRWGQKVFETNNHHIGWDGKFNGALLPMDVYAYTLEAEFFDGTRVRKTGDITLIR